MRSITPMVKRLPIKRDESSPLFSLARDEPKSCAVRKAKAITAKGMNRANLNAEMRQAMEQMKRGKSRRRENLLTKKRKRPRERRSPHEANDISGENQNGGLQSLVTARE